MLRSKLIIGVALLVLLGAVAGCGGDLEPPPEEANTLDRTVEETIVVSEQLAEEPDVGLAQPNEGATALGITGYVTVDAYHYDAATGTYVLFYHDEGSNVITTIGIDFIAQQLSGVPSATEIAKWISLSNDGTSLASWTQLPTEINASGMTRAVGTYAHTASTNTYTVEATFTATGAVTVQTTGLQWVVTPASNTNLMAANDFASVVLATDDTLKITWTITLS